MADAALGSFPEGADEEYFAALQALVNEVHEKWVGGPCPFNDLAQAVNGGAKRDHLGGVRRDRLAAAGLSP